MGFLCNTCKKKSFSDTYLLYFSICSQFRLATCAASPSSVLTSKLLIFPFSSNQSHNGANSVCLKNKWNGVEGFPQAFLLYFVNTFVDSIL